MWCPSASSTAQPVPFHPHPDRRLDSTDGGCGGVPRCSLSQAPSWASSATRDDPRNPTFPRTCRGMTATSPRAPPCPSFFNLLSAKNKIVRGPEEEKTFEHFKAYLENLAILTSPRDIPKLLLYIAVSASAVSAPLVEEKYQEGNMKQVHVYFVSEALAGAKKFYSEV